jgi:zinc transporter ZupT
MVCTFFDGIALTASLGAGLHIGLMVGLGLLFHLLPEGMVAATVVRRAGRSQAAAALAATMVGLALLAGVGAANLIGSTLGTLAVGVPFAAGVVLWTLSHQMAPAALRGRHGVPAFGTAATLILLLEFLLPHVHLH